MAHGLAIYQLSTSYRPAIDQLSTSYRGENAAHRSNVSTSLHASTKTSTREELQLKGDCCWRTASRSNERASITLLLCSFMSTAHSASPRMLWRSSPSGMWLLAVAVHPTPRGATGDARSLHGLHGGGDEAYDALTIKLSSSFVGTSSMRTAVAKTLGAISTSCTVWKAAMQ